MHDQEKQQIHSSATIYPPGGRAPSTVETFKKIPNANPSVRHEAPPVYSTENSRLRSNFDKISSFISSENSLFLLELPTSELGFLRTTKNVLGARFGVFSCARFPSPIGFRCSRGLAVAVPYRSNDLRDLIPFEEDCHESSNETLPKP